MPSSTSNSEPQDTVPGTGKGGLKPALTFFDPEHVDRPVPDRPWRIIIVGAIALIVALTLCWELYWRANWQSPGDYKNSDDLWAQERRKAKGDATVIIGSSRIFFDIDLDVWEEVSGVRPIQLALEGTSPQPVLADLAADEDFNGLVIVGVTNGLTFSGYAYRGDAVRHAKEQSISRRIGHRLWMLLDGPFASFTSEATRPKTMIYHANWPLRDGMKRRLEPRQIQSLEADRNTETAARVIEDEEFRELAKEIWADGLRPRIEAMKSGPPDPEQAKKMQEGMDAIIADIAANVEKIRARGGDVAFAQMPYEGMYAELEDVVFPKEQAFDRLVAEADSFGVSFHDYEALQGYYLPEWSHLAPRDAEDFTANFVQIFYDELEAFTSKEPAGAE